MILVWFASFLANSNFSSVEQRLNFFTSGLYSHLAFSSSLSVLAKYLTNSWAIAGEAVKPGDCIPAALMNPSFSLITKSFDTSTALQPANELITDDGWTLGTSYWVDEKTTPIPSLVVDLSSLSSISSAVGPTIIVPSTVGITRAPFDLPVGSGKIMRFTMPSRSLSRRNS